MSEDRIREKFVWKLFEKTVINEIENIDNDCRIVGIGIAGRASGAKS